LLLKLIKFSFFLLFSKKNLILVLNATRFLIPEGKDPILSLALRNLKKNSEKKDSRENNLKKYNNFKIGNQEGEGPPLFSRNYLKLM
jgi:hypothetical protein